MTKGGPHMPEMDRRLRHVAQLRAIWRGFRDPQERREDERLSRSIVQMDELPSHSRESAAVYGVSAVRAAIRWWWCEGQFDRIVEFAERLDARVFDADPLVRIYIEEARARLSG